jgi:outer membrane cobalamin receptor
MRFPIAVALFVVVFSTFVAAQTPATLTGTLTDPSGAAIAGAEVVAEPRGANPDASIRTRSDDAGRYSLTLPPGSYRVRITHSSFARLEQEMTFAAGETREWSPRLVLERMAATVVVSAHAEPALAATVATPIAVLTAEDITQRRVISLPTLLAATPGISVSQGGRGGGPTSLFLNGGNSNFTKVFVDGAPVNEPGGAVDFSNFTLGNIEKVEVVRGAESALFGSDAMAGVIQVFTRRGTAAHPVFTMLGEGGNFASGHGAAQLSGAWRRFDYSAAAAYASTEGVEVNEQFRNTTLSGNFGFRLSDTHQMRLAVRDNSSDAGVAGQTLLQPPNLDQHNALKNLSAHLSWEYTTGPRWQHRTAGSEARLTQLFDNPVSDFCQTSPPFLCDFTYSVRNAYNRAGFNHQSSYLFAGGGVTLGYQLEVENGFFGGQHGHRDNHGGYLEARKQFGRRLVLSGGFRVEGNDSFGTRWVPRGGVSYIARFGQGLFGATRLRFSAGEGIKEPSLSQSFAQDPCFPGNPALRAEKNRSFNVGGEQMLADDRVRISADGFFNQFRDVVSFTFCFPGAPCPIPPPPGCTFGYGTFFNTDLSRANGMNLAVEARPWRWLRLAGNYTYLDTRVLKAPNAFDPAQVPGNRLLRRPVHSGNLNINADAWGMNWNLATRFVGQRTDSDFLGLGLTTNPGFVRVDLAASYDLRRGITAFGRIENLFDEEYQETLGFPALPRNFRLGMKFTLGSE